MVSIVVCWNRISSVIIVVVLLAGGCANVPSIPGADQNSRQGRVEAAVQEAKAESAALRADLASARITAAKQEAELRELRRQVNELQQIIDAKQADLTALREERDRMAKSATIAQVHVADPSALPASAADVTSLQAKLHEMESALAALTTELAQVRKDMNQSASVLKSKPASVRPSRPGSP